MEITEKKAGDVVTLSLSGRLDATTAKMFESKILARIESGDRRFIIDLAQLDYISSAGLRVLVLAAKQLASVKGRIVLCSLKKPVREVFDIVGFSSTFPLYASPEDAIKNI
jgi:anti-sigma B factor antagonist